MNKLKTDDEVILVKTNVINDTKLIGKKGRVDFQCIDGMVWVKFGRSLRCVHPDYLSLVE